MAHSSSSSSSSSALRQHADSHSDAALTRRLRCSSSIPLLLSARGCASHLLPGCCWQGETAAPPAAGQRTNTIDASVQHDPIHSPQGIFVALALPCIRESLTECDAGVGLLSPAASHSSCLDYPVPSPLRCAHSHLSRQNDHSYALRQRCFTSARIV